MLPQRRFTYVAFNFYENSAKNESHVTRIILHRGSILLLAAVYCAHPNLGSSAE